MLKRELVGAVAARLGEMYHRRQVFGAVDVVLDEIVGALLDERRVELRGFGSFSVRGRKPRSTKNPRTGKMMHIRARKTIHFTMSKALKEALIGGRAA